MTKVKVDVIIPPGYKPPRKDVGAAWILAEYYQSTVSILKPVNKYRVKTPDFEINSVRYELKVLTSSQVRQLSAKLDEAKEQSDDIAIDIRKSKISEKRATEVCLEFLQIHKSCKIHLIVSARKVVDIIK